MASYERVMKILSISPVDVGVYSEETEKNLEFTGLSVCASIVADAAYLFSTAPRSLIPGSISASGLLVSTIVLTMAMYMSLAQTLWVDETMAM